MIVGLIHPVLCSAIDVLFRLYFSFLGYAKKYLNIDRDSGHYGPTEMGGGTLAFNHSPDRLLEKNRRILAGHDEPGARKLFFSPYFSLALQGAVGPSRGGRHFHVNNWIM